jgi:hypothetical protein
MTSFQPSLAANNSVALFLGASNSTNNGSTFTYNHVADGSSANNIVLKMVSGSSQLALNGTTTTITGPLSIGTRILGSQDISTVYTFANTQASTGLSWASLPSVNRVVINIARLIRTTPTTSNAVIQFGYNNNWISGATTNYIGCTMSYQATPVQSALWTSSGLVLTANWVSSGNFLYYSGQIVLTYTGKIGGIDVWSIYGGISTPTSVNVSGTILGPYNIKYCGHFYANATYPVVNMIRFTTTAAGEVFGSGSVSISTE